MLSWYGWYIGWPSRVIASLHHDGHPQHGDGLQHLPDPVHGDPYLPAAATAVTRLQDGAGNQGTDLRSAGIY